MVWGEHHCTLEHVPYDMVGLELKELAKKYDWSKSLTFARTYHRGPVCYGMLEFTDPQDMRAAIKSFNGRVIEGGTEKINAYEGNNYYEVWYPPDRR